MTSVFKTILNSTTNTAYFLKYKNRLCFSNESNNKTVIFPPDLLRKEAKVPAAAAASIYRDRSRSIRESEQMAAAQWHVTT